MERTSQLRSFSCQTILVLTVLSLTFSLRVSTYLTIDEINILSLFTPACHLNAAFVIWVIEKGYVVPIKDFLDLVLLSYLLYYQMQRNKMLNGSGKYKLQRPDIGTSEFYECVGMEQGERISISEK
jgi:hypothetical protein